MTIAVRRALAALVLILLVASPVLATEPVAPKNDKGSTAPVALPDTAANQNKAGGCMPDGGCCGGGACEQAAGANKAAADTATGGCPCMKRRQAADTPS